MRIVIDTNIIVSSIIKPKSPPGIVLENLIGGRVVCLCDDRIFREYREVLYRPKFHFVVRYIDLLLDFIERNSEYISASTLAVELPDETDRPFLEVAADGRADALVTGNVKDFKPTRGGHNVRVVSPAEFLRNLAQ